MAKLWPDKATFDHAFHAAFPRSDNSIVEDLHLCTYMYLHGTCTCALTASGSCLVHVHLHTLELFY